MIELYFGSMYLLYQLTYLTPDFSLGCSKAPQMSGITKAIKRAAYQFLDSSDFIIESKYLSITRRFCGNLFAPDFTISSITETCTYNEDNTRYDGKCNLHPLTIRN